MSEKTKLRFELSKRLEYWKKQESFAMDNYINSSNDTKKAELKDKARDAYLSAKENAELYEYMIQKVDIYGR